MFAWWTTAARKPSSVTCLLTTSSRRFAPSTRNDGSRRTASLGLRRRLRVQRLPGRCERPTASRRRLRYRLGRAASARRARRRNGRSTPGRVFTARAGGKPRGVSDAGDRGGCWRRARGRGEQRKRRASAMSGSVRFAHVALGAALCFGCATTSLPPGTPPPEYEKRTFDPWPRADAGPGAQAPDAAPETPPPADPASDAGTAPAAAEPGLGTPL